MKKNVSLLGVPTHWGVGVKDLVSGPKILREFGIIQKLAESGFVVEDAGDINCEPNRKTSVENPRAKFLDEVAMVSEKTAKTVADIITSGQTPLVLGGIIQLTLAH